MSAWSTDDELAFLKRLGKHSEQSRGVPREELLRRYWLTAARRVRWGAIERAPIIAYLRMMLLLD